MRWAAPAQQVDIRNSRAKQFDPLPGRGRGGESGCAGKELKLIEVSCQAFSVERFRLVWQQDGRMWGISVRTGDSCYPRFL